MAYVLDGKNNVKRGSARVVVEGRAVKRRSARVMVEGHAVKKGAELFMLIRVFLSVLSC